MTNVSINSKIRDEKTLDLYKKYSEIFYLAAIKHHVSLHDNIDSIDLNEDNINIEELYRYIKDDHPELSIVNVTALTKKFNVEPDNIKLDFYKIRVLVAAKYKSNRYNNVVNVIIEHPYASSTLAISILSIIACLFFGI